MGRFGSGLNLINIGAGECRNRLNFGLVALAVGIVIAVVFIFTGVDDWWRVVLFLPFWLGALGFFQSMEKT